MPVFDQTGGRGLQIARPVEAISKGKLTRAAVEKARLENKLLKKEVRAFDKELELAERDIAHQEEEARASTVRAHADYMEAVRKAGAEDRTIAGDTQDFIQGQAETARVLVDGYENMVGNLGEETARAVLEMQGGVYNQAATAGGMPPMPLDIEYLKGLAKSTYEEFASKGKQQADLVDSETGKPVSGSFDAETGKFYVDGKEVSGERYFPMPGGTLLADLGPTRAQKTDLRIRREQLSVAKDLIVDLKAQARNNFGIPGTVNFVEQKVFGIFDDISDAFDSEAIDKTIELGRLAANAISPDMVGDVKEGQKLLDEMFNEELGNTKLYEYALGLALARNTQPTGRIPVELIKMSLERVKLRGFSSQQEVLGRLNFLDSHFEEGIRVIDSALNPGAAEDAELQKLLEEAQLLGIDVDNL